MNLSNPRRLAKLIRHLLWKPWRIPNYLSTSLTSRTPLDLGLPWWSRDAIEAIGKWVTPNTTVFEYGTGGSTVFLGHRTGWIECVEDDESWAEKTRATIQRVNLDNVKIHCDPYDFSCLDDFAQSSYMNRLKEPHDLIVIDGQDNYHFDQNLSARTICFRHAQGFVKKGGAIVVDDSWRYPEIREITDCKTLVIHESTGPCRPGVTSTDLHYY